MSDQKPMATETVEAKPGCAPAAGSAATRLEIKEAIIWYEKHGYDWLSVVGYLSAKAIGFGPPWIVRTRIGVAMRKPTQNDQAQRPGP